MPPISSIGIKIYVGYCISYDGIIFHRHGGYKGNEKRIKEDRDFLVRKMKLEEDEIQSVIDTNSAVRNNLVNQNKFNKRSIYLAAASTLFILITVYFQATDTTAQELQLIRQQLQKTSQSLDSLRLSQQGINASMMKFYAEKRNGDTADN